MSIRSHISGWLRQMNLLTIAEQARFYMQKLKYRKENEDFKKENPNIKLPPEFFVYETYRLNYKWYYEDGMNTTEEIIELLSKYFDLTKPGFRILDWGCGPGRIVRHIPALLPTAGVYGTDYNEKYIDWCSENLKGIRFSVNNTEPPLNYNDSFFDAVIGFSILTHLSEKNHYRWVNELYRIVKPAGGVFITTQGEAYHSRLTEPEKKLFDSNLFVERRYLKEGNRLYSSFQPREFMKRLIAGKFDLVAFIPGKMENNEPSQDCWILRKV